MAFHVALAFPLMLWPARNILDEILEIFPVVEKVNKKIRFVIITVVLVSISFGIAVKVPNITIVFGKNY